jgi:hypothetical protein
MTGATAAFPSVTRVLAAVGRGVSIRAIDAGQNRRYDPLMREPPKFKIGNAWWTATVISASLTILVLFLDYLGVFGDLGL